MRARAALHYASLGAHLVAAFPPVPAANAKAAFTVQVTAIRKPARIQNPRLEPSPKHDAHARKLMERIMAREADWARRTALDLQRLEDLQDRQEQRRAHALRQEWFVLGRVVAAAMRDDAFWRARIMPLLEQAPLTRKERQVLGLLRD